VLCNPVLFALVEVCRATQTKAHAVARNVGLLLSPHSTYLQIIGVFSENTIRVTHTPPLLK